MGGETGFQLRLLPVDCSIYVGRKAWIRTIHGWNSAKRGSKLRADNPCIVPRVAPAQAQLRKLRNAQLIARARTYVASNAIV